MRKLIEKIRANWKASMAAFIVALAIWALFDFRSGFLEGTGWGPKQWGSKFGKWLTEAPAPEKKLETGSIPQAPPAKPEQTDAQKREAAARTKRARCEKERGAELIEAEKELAVYGYRVNACIAEARQSIFTAGNPERACKVQIDAKGEYEARRDALAARKC